jgi:hypothetical protein
MTHLLSFNTTNAKAQQEIFVQYENAGRRFPVVFSHFLFTYLNNNNTRKGAFTQLSHSASDASARRLSTNQTKEVTNSLPESGRLASIVSKKFNKQTVFHFFHKP